MKVDIIVAEIMTWHVPPCRDCALHYLWGGVHEGRVLERPSTNVTPAERDCATINVDTTRSRLSLSATGRRSRICSDRLRATDVAFNDWSVIRIR